MKGVVVRRWYQFWRKGLIFTVVSGAMTVIALGRGFSLYRRIKSGSLIGNSVGSKYN